MMTMPIKKKWFEVLTPAQQIHWVENPRSGAQWFELFPDLDRVRTQLPKRFTQKRAIRNEMAKNSRRANR